MKFMKLNKSHIILATLGVVNAAYAQSGVSLSGNLDLGFKVITHTDSTKNKSEFISNNSSTSLLYFKGNKDLGDGMKASFLLEIDPNPTQSSTLNGSPSGNAYNGTPFNGEQYVGLAGGFGDFKFGAPNSAALTAGTISQPFSTALGGGYSAAFGRMGTASISGINQFDANTGGRIIRHEKTMMYTTPVFVGIKGTVEYAAGNSNSTTPSNNTNAYTAASLQYNSGPLNIMYVYANEKAGDNGAAGPTAAIGTAPTVSLPAGTDISWNMLAANYTFGSATVMAGYTTTKHNAAVVLEDATSWNIAGKYAVTPKIELLANYLVRDSNLPANADATLLGLGLNYFIDPTVNLYVRYEGLRFVATGATPSQNQDSTAVGIRYQF